MPEDNVIFVGKKPVMNYVGSVVAQAKENKKEIILKARGKAITTAVDVAQIALRKFTPEYEIGTIKIGTDEREITEKRVKEGNTTKVVKLESPKKINVSTIEIHLIKSE